MDWKPFVCRVSCSNIKQKTCFLNRRGSNILEPRLQYNGARAPIYWSPLNIWNLILWLIENIFLSWINPIQMDWVLLNLICVIAKKYFRPTSLFCKTNFDGPGSIILEPRLQYIGAPLVQKTCFLFYFWTWNTANKRFPVHYLDHDVIHKTWFYQNSPSSFLPRILKMKFRGSNILEPGSNILEPPHVPDWQRYIIPNDKILSKA